MRYIAKIMILCLSLIFLVGCRQHALVPENGVWFCDELQIQLSFQSDSTSYCIVDGEKVPCANENDTSTNDILVLWQGDKTLVWDVGDLIFGGECVFFDSSKMHIIEYNSGVKYVFKRIA